MAFSGEGLESKAYNTASNGPTQALIFIAENHPSWLMRTLAKVDNSLRLSVGNHNQAVLDDLKGESRSDSYSLDRPAKLSWLMRAGNAIDSIFHNHETDQDMKARSRVLRGEQYHGDAAEDREITANKSDSPEYQAVQMMRNAVRQVVYSSPAQQFAAYEEQRTSSPWNVPRAESQPLRVVASPGRNSPVARYRAANPLAVQSAPVAPSAIVPSANSAVVWQLDTRVSNPANPKTDMPVLRTMPIKDRDALVEVMKVLTAQGVANGQNGEPQGFIQESQTKLGHYYIAIPATQDQQIPLLSRVETALGTVFPTAPVLQAAAQAAKANNKPGMRAGANA